VAFPAISCGVFGYPIDQAAAIAVTTLRAALPGSTVEEVVLAAREGEVERALRAAASG
jgi:O-acetyl-ADP-ribose deacetylase (regulator of RNase III)